MPKRQARAKTKPSRTAGPSVLALLRADHEAVTALFDRYEKTKGMSQKNALAAKICNELKVHAQVEEEIFYPELRQAEGTGDVDDMLNEADVEHDGAKKLIAEIEASSADDELFDARITVLSEYIKHHVKEEQSDIFKAARKSSLDLKEVGARLAARKKQLKREFAKQA